jgi:sensor histidine kinase YesM
MEKINNFLEKSSLWKVFFIGWLFGTIISFVLWSLLSLTNTTFIILNKLMYTSIALGFLVGGCFTTLFVSIIRESSKYWQYSEQLEKLIEQANTKNELDEIYKNEFQELRKLSMGNPHFYETKRIYTMLEMKYKFLKE